jgi:hypothetical protein
MRDGVARIGGGLAFALALFLGLGLLVALEPSFVTVWAVALCGVGGALALGSRHGLALLFLVLGAAPVIVGLGVLFVPSICLVAVGAIPAHREAVHT